MMTGRYMDTRLPLVILGAGGHAKVLLSLIQASGAKVLGVCDPQLAANGASEWRGIPVLGEDSSVLGFAPDAIGLVNGIGQLVGTTLREMLFVRWQAAGYQFPALVHPAAWVDISVTLGPGAQVMAGAVIQADVCVGANTIINTRVALDHDCVVGAHVHVAPGATLCGNVLVCDRAFIAAGSTILQGLKVGSGAVLAAGAVLIRDLPDDQISFGISARR
jgi:UDP-perosamine 4-acetyltransferase